MQRRRYQRPAGNYPLPPNSGAWSTAPMVAALPRQQWHEIPKETATFGSVPVAFDHVNIIATPSTGTTTFLIGDGVNTIANEVTSPVPLGMIGHVDGIFPYLEGAAGPVTQPRIPGSGVTYTWRVLVQGKADRAYGAITTIIAPWNGATAMRPLLVLRPTEQLTCSVTVTDPNGLYSYVGIRIMGRWIPEKVSVAKIAER